MTRRAPICGKCGAVVVEAEAVVTLTLVGCEPRGETTLCPTCTGLVVGLLGSEVFREEGPRKGVVDPRGFQTR